MSLQVIITIISLLLASLFGAFSIPQMFPEILSQSILNRIIISLLLPIILGLVILLISTFPRWIGYVKKISNKLAYILFLLIFHPFARVVYLTIILLAIIFVSNFNYLIIALSAIALLIFLWSLKQFPLQEFKKNKKEIIFEDDFVSNKGWIMNYWGTTNPDKTNRIESSMIIFEATENELLHPNKEFGAYIDLKNGIDEGSAYEVSCLVKSEPGTTMKFQLWLHDNVIGNNSSMRTEKNPAQLKTPGNDFEKIKLEFIATVTKGIRIHLHNQGGVGKIIVDKVTVSRLI